MEINRDSREAPDSMMMVEREQNMELSVRTKQAKWADCNTAVILGKRVS